MKNKWCLFLVFVCGFLGVAHATTYYVNSNNSSPASPYDSWSTASTNIQAAIDLTHDGDTVFVTNGTYLVASEILITNAITVQSISGAMDTIIDGEGTHRCFNLGSGACTIRGFTIQHGYSSYKGGGIYCSSTTPIVENCIIKNNSAGYGGGMYYGTANNCTIRNNSAQIGGGGMYYGTANNCSIINNSAIYSGGGICRGTANNCSIINNSVIYSGGGMYRGTANNCIVWYNNASEGNNLLSTTARYSCSPDVIDGSNGCMTNEPAMASTDHLLSTSPCIGAGNFSYCHGTDLDGEAWKNPPSMGCDEFNASTTGSLDLSLEVSHKLVGVNFPLLITPSVLGPCTQSILSFGDGTILTNRIGNISHTWVSEGTYSVILTAYNTSYPSGLSITQQVSVVGSQYVSPVGNDANDGLSWATPKKTIQAAINIESTIYGGTVWVTNGTYLVDAEILITNAITVQSVNGATNTIIDGGGTHCCFNLGSSACTIRGFTIQHGKSSDYYGGGIYCSSTTPVAERCIIKNNLSTRSGGGMYRGTANNCLFIDNLATDVGGGMSYGAANNCLFKNNSSRSGGGMYRGTANNCTIINNSAIIKGGGIYSGTANNCIVWYNRAPEGSNLISTTARYSCSPDVTNGSDGCITNEPAMASMDHLSSISPCIGAGNFLYCQGTDLDGEVWENPPSMGCDEFNATTTDSLSLVLKIPSLIATNRPIFISPSVLGPCTQSILSFGDGMMLTNRILEVSHTWVSEGTYPVILTAYNASYPFGVSITQQVTVIVGEPQQYVSPVGNDSNDGRSWETPKKTIQAAVDTLYDGVVWVTNGTYLLPSEVLVKTPVLIQSVNGAATTIVDGGNSNRCFNLKSNGCTVRGFTIQNGYADINGGGVYCSSTNSFVENCTVINNFAGYGGGGIFNGTINHCTFLSNYASARGGAVFQGVANNCSMINNFAHTGGGMRDGIVNNCTIIGNIAGYSGGGILNGEAYNSIIYHNTSPRENDSKGGIIKNSCSSDVINGVDGNITNAPLLVSLSHIASNSPCRGAGNSLYCTGTDVDNEPWLNPPSIGCDEFYDNTVADGPIQLFLLNIPKKGIVHSDYAIQAVPIGKISRFYVDFGDGQVVSNQLFLSHAWDVAGEYDIVLTAFNDDYSTGLSITQRIEILTSENAMIYVSQSTGDDANNGESWATAKKTIQSGVDAQDTLHGTVLISNGTYSVSSEIRVKRDITLKSVNGADVTIVDGGGANRCFNLGPSICTVSGFTIQNGSSDNGGGVFCQSSVPIIKNCIVQNNEAVSYGGGLYRGIIQNCIVKNNSAGFLGGGAFLAFLDNCTVINNTASSGGGGLREGTANNCIVLGNSHNFSLTRVRYSCSPDVTSGVNGNITNAPSFVDQAAENYHLESDSPCINWGNNSAAKGSADLDGNPRIVEVYVDMGCYEYQTLLGAERDQDGNGCADAWERENFGGHVNPNENADGDPQSNGEEYITGTDPLDSNDYFYIVSTTNAPNGFSLYFNSFTNRKYQLFTTTNLTENSWVPVLPIRSGVGALDSMSDTNAIPAHKFYQIKVSLP